MKLLIVEDDADFAAALSRAMGKRGFEVAVAHDAITARAIVETFAPSHAVVDLKLPGESGLKVVEQLAARTPAPDARDPPDDLSGGFRPPPVTSSPPPAIVSDDFSAGGLVVPRSFCRGIR